MKITLPTDTRYYQDESWILRYTHKCIPKGTEVDLGPIVSMPYDDRNQDVVPFQMDGKECYFLVHEIKIVGLHKKLEQQSNLIMG